MAVTIGLPREMEREAEAAARARGESLPDLTRRLLAAYLHEIREQVEDATAVDAALARIGSGLGSTPTLRHPSGNERNAVHGVTLIP